MSQKHKFKKSFRRVAWKEYEFEIELPLYRKYHSYYSMVYVKVDEQLNGTVVTVSDDCITDSGSHQNLSYEIQFEKPHLFDYDYGFYAVSEGNENKVIDEKEWSKVIAQVLQALSEN